MRSHSPSQGVAAGGLLFASLFIAASAHAGDRSIVFIAGRPSHGPMEHEHRAGCLLLQKCLTGFQGVTTQVFTNGWPADDHALDSASAIVIYSDGGGGHPALQGDHLRRIDGLMKKGVGFGCLHYAVEPTREKGEKEFIDWMGGCFSVHYSVNPHWNANFSQLPKHPITRGVDPFATLDEWYFNMRFRPGMDHVTPILTAVPPAKTMDRTDGTHSGNPDVRKKVAAGEPTHVAWAAERDGGGRGFGFTGGHFHKGWANDNQRKLVLNAILWIAHVEVPTSGVESKVTPADLLLNLDPK